MRSCPTTRAYVARRTAEGKNPREIRRCLKRYIARQLYRTLDHRHDPRNRDQLTDRDREMLPEPLDIHRSVKYRNRKDTPGSCPTSDHRCSANQARVLAPHRRPRQR